MNASRIRVGLAVGLLGLALSAGTAAAAELEGTSCSTCKGDVQPNTVVAPAVDTPAPSGETLPSNELALTPEEEAPAGTLPLTGGDVAGLVLLGGAAIGVGTVLVRRSRTA
jgi:hypothetical protein